MSGKTVLLGSNGYLGKFLYRALKACNVPIITSSRQGIEGCSRFDHFSIDFGAKNNFDELFYALREGRGGHILHNLVFPKKEEILTEERWKLAVDDNIEFCNRYLREGQGILINYISIKAKHPVNNDNYEFYHRYRAEQLERVVKLNSVLVNMWVPNIYGLIDGEPDLGYKYLINQWFVSAVRNGEVSVLSPHDRRLTSLHLSDFWSNICFISKFNSAGMLNKSDWVGQAQISLSEILYAIRIAIRNLELPEPTFKGPHVNRWYAEPTIVSRHVSEMAVRFYNDYPHLKRF